MRKKLEAMAVDYLRQQKNRNINLLSALQGGLAEVKAATERGCLLCTAGRIWQIAAADTQTALEFFGQVPTDATMLEVQDTIQIEPIAQRFQPACIETYYNAWYEKASITVPEIGIQVHTEQLEDAPRLAPYYHMPGPAAGDVASVEHYLYDRIRSGAVFYVSLGDALVGFAGTHEEGSIGLLTVLPAYRRRGLGTYLEQVAIQRALERGHIPFGQIAEHNTASLALQRSLGMTVSKELVCWMER